MWATAERRSDRMAAVWGQTGGGPKQTAHIQRAVRCGYVRGVSHILHCVNDEGLEKVHAPHAHVSPLVEGFA